MTGSVDAFSPSEYIISFDKTIQNTKSAERKAGGFSLQEGILFL